MQATPMIKLGLASGLIGFVGMFAVLTLTETPAHADGPGGGGDNPFGSGPVGVGGGESGGEETEEFPDQITLTGVVRDFRERSAENGHPDFERQPDGGFGQYAGNVATFIGDDDKPVFTGDGRKVMSNWRDEAGRNICYALASVPGDTAGTWGSDDTSSTESEESFNQWYRDVPGTNQSQLLSLTLNRQVDGTYVFDDKDDATYSSLGGFFPIEDQLLGNPGGSPDRNFHFTFELHTEFVFDSEQGQEFRFLGDDDVWVYINGNLVIDLGGVHGATEQYIDLNRLGLTDGETYALDFFFAERHRTQSNFRIATNINLSTVKIPSVTAAYD